MTSVELPADELLEQNIARSLAEVPHPSLPKGSNLYGGTKLFPDYQARGGECYFTLVHGIAHESSVSYVAVLQATRALRKGFESAIYCYGPGAINCIANRGFPTTGDAAFPGETNVNNALETFIKEGGRVYCCRFGLALHGAREEDLIEGVIPAHPLDVQDALIHYSRKGALAAHLGIGPVRRHRNRRRVPCPAAEGPLRGRPGGAAVHHTRTEGPRLARSLTTARSGHTRGRGSVARRPAFVSGPACHNGGQPPG